MTEHESLVEAILDDPDDDARQLVYADWLEEHGSFADGKRAQLIRLEVEDARLPPTSPKREPLLEQIKALRSRYTWLIIPSLPPGFENPSVERGLVRIRVSLAVPRFTEWGEDYLRGLPCYCRLLLDVNRSPAKGKLLALLDAPAWPRVYGFSLIKYHFGKGEAERFLSDPRMRNLEHLFIRCQGMDDGVLNELATPGRFERLSYAVLWDGVFSDVGLDALTRSNAVSRLKTLRLERGAITSRAVAAFEKKRPGVLDCPA